MVSDGSSVIGAHVGIDIDVTLDTGAAARSDQLSDTVSYGDIARAVTTYVEASSFELIEALGEQVASLILEQFSVETVRLKLATPGAVANARQVAIVLERSRA